MVPNSRAAVKHHAKDVVRDGAVDERRDAIVQDPCASGKLHEFEGPIADGDSLEPEAAGFSDVQDAEPRPHGGNHADRTIPLNDRGCSTGSDDRHGTRNRRQSITGGLAVDDDLVVRLCQEICTRLEDDCVRFPIRVGRVDRGDQAGHVPARTRESGRLTGDDPAMATTATPGCLLESCTRSPPLVGFKRLPTERIAAHRSPPGEQLPSPTHPGTESDARPPGRVRVIIALAPQGVESR